MAIFDLPLELMLSVLRLLESQHLATVTRVCKSLKKLAEPLLYHTIVFNWRIPSRPAASSSPIQGYPHINSFFRSIHKRPELALYIKHIHFHYTTYGCHSSELL